MRPVTKILAGCLVLLLASACSKIQVGYGLADWYLSHEAHKYLKLDNAGEQKLKASIKAYMKWHRAEMLPLYASACRKMAVLVRDPEADPDGLRLAPSMLDGLYAATLEPWIAPSAEILLSLDARGVDHLQQAMEARQQKEYQKYIQDQQATKKRQQAALAKGLKDFTGPLSDEQLRQLTDLNATLQFPVEAWLAENERRRGELLELLRHHAAESKVEAALRDWWLRPHTKLAKPDPTRLDPEKIQKYWRGFLGLLTPVQRQRAALRLEAYAADFEELSRAPVAAPRPTAGP